MLSDAKFVTLVPIRDMDRAVRFYTKVLGGELKMRPRGKMRDFWASVKIGRSEFWLIQPEKQEKRELAYSTFAVKDIRAVVKDLRGRGVRFLRAERMSEKTRVEGPIAHDRYGSSAFFKDSEGNMIMLWQSP